MEELYALVNAERNRHHESMRALVLVKTGEDIGPRNAEKTKSSAEFIEEAKVKAAAEIAGVSPEKIELSTLGLGYEEE